MILSFSNKAFVSLVLTSTLTSALVVPRGFHHVVPSINAYGDGNGQHRNASGYHTTGYPVPSTMASSTPISLEISSVSTSCTTSSTATVTVSGSSIVPSISQTYYYPTSESTTVYGYPASLIPSSNVSSSTMSYSTRSSVPPSRSPTTSGYPTILPTSMVTGPTDGGRSLAIASSFNSPMPYPSNPAAAVSVAPYPTTMIDLQGAKVSYNTNPTGAASTSHTISTGCITPPTYGTGHPSLSSAAPYLTESGIYISNTLDSAIYPTPPPMSPASSTISVYVPTSSLPAVSGNMTTQYSPSQPVASAYPEQPAVPISVSIASNVPALDTATGGPAYPSSSFMPLPVPTSAAMSSSSVALSTLVTSAVPSSATSGVYDAPPTQSTAGYGVGPSGNVYYKA